tara:strand:- start:59 stop:1084 length:1026 start_codon:yes stop_codon:yes gene_type:complete
MRSIVVGGGVAGLAASVQLAADGHEVMLVEQRDTLGGRVRMREKSKWLLDPGLHLLRRKGAMNQLLRKLRAPRVLGQRWDNHNFNAIGSDKKRALEVLTAMSVGNPANKTPQFVIPRGGWSSLVGRMIAAANQVGVTFNPGSTAESLNLKSGKLTSVSVSGKDVECDAVVLATPPSVSARLLESAGLDTSPLDACIAHRVAALDVALEGRPMRPYSGLFDAQSGVIAVDMTSPDRIPEGADPESCTILHAVNLSGHGPEALAEIKELLDSRCSGWRNMTSVRRSTESVMLHPCSPEQRVDASLHIQAGIGLAGAHVISDYHLSDAAVDTGRAAAKALTKNR